MKCIKLEKLKLSGVQKRKQAIQAAIAAGEAVGPRAQRSNRSKKKKEPGTDVKQRTTIIVQKRVGKRFEESVPSPTDSQRSKLKKSHNDEPKKAKPGTSSQDTSGVSFN